jgi:hypothetical protein
VSRQEVDKVNESHRSYFCKMGLFTNLTNHTGLIWVFSP